MRTLLNDVAGRLISRSIWTRSAETLGGLVGCSRAGRSRQQCSFCRAQLNGDGSFNEGYVFEHETTRSSWGRGASDPGGSEGYGCVCDGAVEEGDGADC